MEERKLAHVERIVDIRPIEGKNNLDATVLGWHVMIKPNEFKIGDLVIYVETDSIMPKLPEYEFLEKYDYRVKTQSYFKGTFVSQGLILPLSVLNRPEKDRYAGENVTEWLGITKYLSKSEQEELQQEVSKKHWTKDYKITKWLWRYKWFRDIILPKKQLPEWLPYIQHTDEERIQNIPKILEQYKDKEVYISEKIDYCSGTFTMKKLNKYEGILGKLIPTKELKLVVCSRNKIVYDKNSIWWKVAIKYNLDRVLKENPSLIIQGECGDGKVQGNKYGITEPQMWIFNIIDHENNYHFNYPEMFEFSIKNNLQCVPLAETRFTKFPKLGRLGRTVQELVEFSKGKSILADIPREGVVIRCIENGKKILSFKVISPDFLLQYKL